MERTNLIIDFFLSFPTLIGNPVHPQRLTCLTIARRLSTIKNADRIIVIHNRRIIEEGTYAELIAKNGFYAHLYAMQQNQEDISEEMFK